MFRMTKVFVQTSLLLLLSCSLRAQQYGLFGTGTLFDGFENPAQKTFKLDSSRKFASNFFLPYFGLKFQNRGNETFFRELINTGLYDTSNIPLGTGEMNTGVQSSNIYLATLKIFHSYKYHKEIGLSWQVKTDGQLDYTNETLAVLENYRRLKNSGIKNFDDAFNNKGWLQSYHQFSLSYRENYTKRLAFGIKLSLLSGISHNKLNIQESGFATLGDSDTIAVRLRGIYQGSFLYWDEVSKKTLVPTFKSPGASISLGTTYTAKNGVFIMGNIKDLGLIRWSRSSVTANFDKLLLIDTATNTARDIENKITDVVIDVHKRKRHYTPTNARADFMISKPFWLGYGRFSYTPGIIASKNLFYKGGDAAWVNKFQYNDFALSLIPAYNFNNFTSLGIQGLYKTANFEAFVGSDNLFKTSSDIPGAIKATLNENRGPLNASVYMGLSIKFGRTVEHPQNSSTMPGIENIRRR